MAIMAASREKSAKEIRARPKSHRLSDPAQRVVLPGLSWRDYIQIGDILCDRPALRLTFDRGTLEIMVTSRGHESFKSRLSRLIEILAEVFNLRIEPGGNMTFQDGDLEKALEGDNCWWVEHAEQVLGKLTGDAADDAHQAVFLE